MSVLASSSRIALVMGVANPRSIAWSCVDAFARNGWKVIFTCQSEKILNKAQPLLCNKNYENNCVLGGFECDVLRSMEDVVAGELASSLFRQRLADLLQDQPLSAVVHSLAHAPNIKTTPLLQSTREDFLQAQEISAFSLIQVARQTKEFFFRDSEVGPCGSITALSYLGAVRAIPGYHAMGPAKASLESIVRGLAVELGGGGLGLRVNAVSAGPLPTLAAKGGIAGFDQMRQDMEDRAPLGKITVDQVASTVYFLSSEAANGITGQTIYVDGGYSIVGGPGVSSR